MHYQESLMCLIFSVSNSHSLIHVYAGKELKIVWFLFLEKAASVINATGGLLLLFAATVAIIETLYLGFNELFGRKIDSLIFSKHHPGIDTIRYTLGSMVTFALEILVAADVIDTLTKSGEGIFHTFYHA